MICVRYNFTKSWSICWEQFGTLSVVACCSGVYFWMHIAAVVLAVILLILPARKHRHSKSHWIPRWNLACVLFRLITADVWQHHSWGPIAHTHVVGLQHLLYCICFSLWVVHATPCCIVFCPVSSVFCMLRWVRAIYPLPSLSHTNKFSPSFFLSSFCLLYPFSQKSV